MGTGYGYQVGMGTGWLHAIYVPVWGSVTNLYIPIGTPMLHSYSSNQPKCRIPSLQGLSARMDHHGSTAKG